MAGYERLIEVIPSARRLIRSLRDMGYDFNTAVADIIDNSIEARATTVRINIVFQGDGSFVSIADDGCGMDADMLTAAMRYGSERVYSEEDLGRFGLGLKTASMSQCRCLTVASRGASGEIAVRRWDLELIERTDAWALISPRRSECPHHLLAPLKQGTGTVVLWERLDRILGYKQPYGELARKRLAQMCRGLELHLAMVFHRFLSGEAGGRHIRIYINDNLVEPWDPFARSEQLTQALPGVTIPLDYEGIAGQITLQPYVLPHQSRFSSTPAFSRAGGPEKWNRQQGFYIYRADRMIQSGGWCGLRTMDEHTKLARIALDFAPILDRAFRINVAKMRVQLPVEIRSAVELALVTVIRAAQEEYRDGVPGSPGRPGRPDGVRVYSLDEVRKLLMSVAEDSEKDTLRRLFERVTQRTGTASAV